MPSQPTVVTGKVTGRALQPAPEEQMSLRYPATAVAVVEIVMEFIPTTRATYVSTVFVPITRTPEARPPTHFDGSLHGGIPAGADPTTTALAVVGAIVPPFVRRLPATSV